MDNSLIGRHVCVSATRPCAITPYRERPLREGHFVTITDRRWRLQSDSGVTSDAARSCAHEGCE